MLDIDIALREVYISWSQYDLGSFELATSLHSVICGIKYVGLSLFSSVYMLNYLFAFY